MGDPADLADLADLAEVASRRAHRPEPRARSRRATRWVAVVLMASIVAAGCGDTTASPGDRAAAPTTSAVSTTGTSAPAGATDPTMGATTPTSPSPSPPTAARAATWQPVTVNGPAPSPRSSAVLAAAPDGTLWLHGGLVDSRSVAELWHFDGAGWEQIQADGPMPAARDEHVGVWDRERNRLVIALGEDNSGGVFDDVWAFDPATSTWSQIAQGGPAARYGSCAVLDQQGRMVVTHGFSSTVRFDDTWAFDLATSSWTDVTPPTGSRPSARCLHSCAYDLASGELTLFGGRNDDEPYLGDTWRLDATGWSELPVSGPLPRARSRAARNGDAVEVIGGTGDAGHVGDAWRLGIDGWQPAPPGAPAEREAAAVAQGDGVVWLFGGAGPSGALGDLWRSG